MCARGLLQQCVFWGASTAVLTWKKNPHYFCLCRSIHLCSQMIYVLLHWKLHQRLHWVTAEWLLSTCLFGWSLLGGELIPSSLLQLILTCCGRSCTGCVLAPVMPYLFFVPMIIPDRKIILFKQDEHSAPLRWPPLDDFLFTSCSFSLFTCRWKDI